MPSSYLDRYGRARTICHRLPPAAKLLLALAFVFVVISVPIRYWPMHGVLASLIFIGHTLAGIPLSYLAKRLAVFLPMVLLLSLSLPMSQGFRAGWEIMGNILVRSTLAFLTGLWLINVMPFEQMLSTIRRFGVPDVLVAMLAFMYRYFFVVWDELDRMRVARRARTFGGGNLIYHWKMSSQLLGMLLIRAMERAERVHGAMCARGWDGRVRFLDDAPAQPTDDQRNPTSP
jgi:cobalt/nickel transport system permease protein